MDWYLKKWLKVIFLFPDLYFLATDLDILYWDGDFFFLFFITCMKLCIDL